MTDTKSKLRNKIKVELAEIPEDMFRKLCLISSNRLYKSDEWKQANIIGITISTEREIDTKWLINKAWDEGKQIAVPKCFPTTKQMEFRLISSYNQLEVAHYGMKEPIESKTKRILPNEIDLLIVPGLLFDELGYRIGFGGGYYDRFLTKFSNNTVAIAIEQQITSKQLPTDQYDMPVEKIFTDKRIISADDI